MNPINLAVGAKRYDGGSGPAVFTGIIPLKPGQLLEGNLSQVSLRDGAQEIGCTASALWPQHPDGSMKMVQIAATLNLASGVQKNLTLRLGDPRTVNGPAQPKVNGAWMRNPRLIGCTSAAHMCESRLAPLPLCPIPNPNLPDQWNKFLTEEWDSATTTYPSWGRIRAKVMADDHSVGLGGSANYNFISAMYYKYMTSGELDRLHEAHHAAQFGSAERLYNGGIPISLYGSCYGSNFSPSPFTNDGVLNGVVFHADGTRFNANPDGWADLAPGAGPVTGTEWYSGVDTDWLMTYQLSGWEQARGAFLCRALELFGRRGFPDNPGTIPLANVLGSNLGTSIIRDNQFKGNYGGRAQWRAWRGVDLLYYLLSPPMALYHHRAAWKASTIPSPRTHKADWLLWAKREHLDFYEAYSQRYVDGHWLKGSWWGTPGWFPAGAAGSGIPQGLPFFQLKLLFYDVMLYRMNIADDPRIQDFIVSAANRLRQCVRGPEPTIRTPGTAYKLGYAIVNAHSNNATDGPQLAGPGDGFWPTTMLLGLFTLAYRITGDTWFRDLADMHASNTRMALADGSKAGFSTPKEMGECYSDAFPSAAWRAGVELGQWTKPGVTDVSILQPDPDPEPTPTPDPDPGGGPMANASEIISIVAPPEVVAGKPFTASITMKNTGTTTWASGGAQPHRLGSQEAQDNVVWGTARVVLPVGLSVAPGAQVAFTRQFTAPMTLGDRPFAWKMLQEAVQWFGPIARLVLKVVADTTPVPEPEPSDLVQRVVALEERAASVEAHLTAADLPGDEARLLALETKITGVLMVLADADLSGDEARLKALETWRRS